MQQPVLQALLKRDSRERYLDERAALRRWAGLFICSYLASLEHQSVLFGLTTSHS
jgi:hypothetical protein